MIDRTFFYNTVRDALFAGNVGISRAAGINIIFNYWDSREDCKDLRWLAYMLATVHHETDRTFEPINEYGKGKTRPYGKKLKMSGVAYTIPDKLYYGRGLVQLTWYENYELMGRLLNLPLLENPDLALDKHVSVQIMFEGMLRASSSFGDFTGKCLEMYFNETKEDWVGARKIINGTDKASLIADYAKTYYSALSIYYIRR